MNYRDYNDYDLLSYDLALDEENMQEHYTRIVFPQFTGKYDGDLCEPLKDLGIKNLLQPSFLFLLCAAIISDVCRLGSKVFSSFNISFK